MTVELAPSPTARSHLYAVDVVRVVTVAMVVSVHSLSVLLPSRPGAAGVVLEVFHSSREVFLLLSALVLTWSAGDRPVPPLAFWRRRAPLVVVPYVVWSAVYFATGGAGGGPAHFALDLLDAGAHFHLYFLLLTLQLYLVAPWVIPWLRARATRPLATLACSAAVELAFTAVAHWGVPVPPPLSWLTTHPGTWLPSYQLYIVAGVLVGIHAQAVAAWCSRHVVALAAVTGAVVASSVAGYAIAVVGGAAPVHASEVFQPAVVVEAIALGALELGIGQRLTAHAGPTALRALLLGSDLSFGVFLGHPLLLEAIQDRTGIPGALAALPPAAAVVVVVAVVVPALALCTGVGVHLLRQTPLSLATTGRPRRRRVAAVQPEAVQRETAQSDATPPAPVPTRTLPAAGSPA